MSSLSKPAALIALGQRAEAKQVILAAVEQAEGHRSRTAELLKVRPSTLYRLIVELGMWTEIDALIALRGWAQRAGRARGPMGGVVMVLAVVAIHLAACAPDESAPDEVLDAPSAAGAPAPAPVEEQPAAPVEQPVEEPAEAAAGAPAPAPVEQPAAAGKAAPEPMNAAGEAAPTPSSAGTSAPAPVPSAGAPAPQAGAGGAGGAPAVDMTPTKCKIASGLVLACDAFSQRYFPSMQVRWSVGHSNYGCATEAPRCVVGAACFVVHTDAGTSEAGVCQ